MHAAFDNTEAWSPMYQRNNKRTGLKNIRCFPYCSEQHIEKGFCGRPVILRVARSYRDHSPPIHAWGEFRRADDPREVDVGAIVSGDVIRARTKDPKSAKAETLNAPYFEGIVEGGEKCRSSPLVKFVFNQRKKGWNYAWQASKHTAKARHAFFAYLFVQLNNEDSYKCVGVYVSPTFILYCRKRKGDPLPGRMGRSIYGVDGALLDDDEEDDDVDDDDYAEAAAASTNARTKRKPAPSSLSKRKRSSAAARPSAANYDDSPLDEDDQGDLFPTSRRKVLHLEPIVSPAKFANGPPSINSALGGVSGGLTPLTALFVSTFGNEGDGPNVPTPSGTRTTATGTPSSWSADDSEEIDFEAANQLDQVVVSRVAAVLNRLHMILTADGTAESLGLPQFALDWFINDLEEFADLDDGGVGTFSFSTTTQPQQQSAFTPRPEPGFAVTPRDLEPLDWNTAVISNRDMLTELAEYLMEESSLTASIRQILARVEEGRLPKDARLKAFIQVFQNEMSNFLARRGYTERELDEALQKAQGGETKPEETSKTLESLDEHVRQVVETQQRLDSARKNPPRSWMRAIGVRPEVDLTGQWRLDDSLLKAFDEVRAKRGIPYMMRKLLGYMETKIVITHTSERVVIGLKSKLLASTEVAYELDGVERIWDVAPPIPWPSKLCETYRAWIDNDTLRYCHTYNGVTRTDRFVRKNASGDRLEMDVYYQEKDQNGIWQTVIFKRGYALRITTLD